MIPWATPVARKRSRRGLIVHPNKECETCKGYPCECMVGGSFALTCEDESESTATMQQHHIPECGFDEMIEQRVLHHDNLGSKDIWDVDDSGDIDDTFSLSQPEQVQSVLNSLVGEMPITRTRIRAKVSPHNLPSRHELYLPSYAPRTPKRTRKSNGQFKPIWQDSLASRRCILHTTQVRRIDAWTMEVVTS